MKKTLQNVKPGRKHILAVNLRPEVSIILSIIPHLFQMSSTQLIQYYLYQVPKDGSKVGPLNGVDPHNFLVGVPDQAGSIHLKRRLEKMSEETHGSFFEPSLLNRTDIFNKSNGTLASLLNVHQKMNWDPDAQRRATSSILHEPIYL